ncbi:HSP20-like chaperone [Parathielavia hyrcaniae]|uniref:HSP20-like chaperone n=1 Tax=Parathielavia hyrcaniae TaxID=113614 RepID=A0AAN6SZX1_9PEZI|nr:HSP20-like chaperone [Parathielavia hyrcaniae]
MMSFFPGSFCTPTSAPETSFVPLFRLLEDFDNYAREAQSGQPTPASRRQRTRPQRSQLTTFTPKFDVRETEETYELHGELAGLERENVNIEFTEPQTIVIRGHVERAYAPEPTNNNNINNKNNNTSLNAQTSETTEAEKSSHRNSFHATVEDDPEDTPATTPASSPKTEAGKPASADSQQVAQPAPLSGETQKQQPQYWRRWERSVGEFSRTFTFPVPVDHDGVTASLSNGILSIAVPKSKKPVARRIEISA